MIAEYDSANIITKRYVHGPGDDEAFLWYEGAGLANKRYLMSDERGSITSVTDSTGAILGINRYDEYGIPASTNIGRFQYTGQTWLAEIGMYNYKARIYSPTLGRFMQTDPIGYGDGMNWYNYVGSDPVNGVDPSGLADVDIIIVTGPWLLPNPSVINCSNGGCDQFRGPDNGGVDGNAPIGYGNQYGYSQQAAKPLAPGKGKPKKEKVAVVCNPYGCIAMKDGKAVPPTRKEVECTGVLIASGIAIFESAGASTVVGGGIASGLACF